MSEIKPCPWCGEQPLVRERSGSIAERETNIGCDNILCPMMPVAGFITSELAIAAWNTRVRFPRKKRPMPRVELTPEELAQIDPEGLAEAADDNA